MRNYFLGFFCGFLFLLSGCIGMIEQKQPSHVNLRIPSPEIEIVYTNLEYISERVRKGDCLSRVIERAFSRYLEEKGYKGIYNFSETLYSVIKTMPKTALRSRNVNLIYPGETIKFRLPYQIVLTKSFNYYLPVKRVYGLERLKAILNFKWLVDYKENYFDCSERSACVEYLLENEGFNSNIVVDETHAWVIVEVKPGKFVHVEAAASQPYIISGKPYIYLYNSIFDVNKGNISEYDWWNVAKENKEFVNFNF